MDKQCDQITNLNKKILEQIKNIFCPFFKNIRIAINLLKNEQNTMLTYSTSMYLNNVINKSAIYINCGLINLNYATISINEQNRISFNIYIKNICDDNVILNNFISIETNGVFQITSDEYTYFLNNYQFTTNDYTLVVIENLTKIELQIKNLIFNYSKFICNEEKLCNELNKCSIINNDYDSN
jgi:hypothetical protein